MIQAIAFYLLATVSVASALLVVTAKNPVHSVLWLITTFFSAAGLFVMLGAEFLAMLLVVVYVGAVAVLFLFVVMMLDVDFVQLREGYAKYFPLAAIVGLILLAEMIVVAVAAAQGGAARGAELIPATDVSNVEAIGRVLYTDYVYIFQAAGIVLLIAMIGAIVLTLRHKPNIKRQDIGRQVNRRQSDAYANVQAESGKGVTLEDLK